MKKKYEELVAEYGATAAVIHLIGFAIVMVVSGWALKQSFEVTTGKGFAALIGAAWVASKVSSPIRIAITIVLTPIVGRFVQKRRERSAPPEDPAA